MSAYAIETRLNFRRISAIVGLSTIDFNNISKTQHINAVGPTIGVQTWVSRPFLMTISAKTTVYKHLNEYHIEINKQYKGIHAFLKYYNLKGFNELSLGIGMEFYYLFKR